MAKHTPGPWSRIGTWVFAESDTPLSDKDPRKINVFTCSVRPQLCSEEEAKANAKLMSAAPDLLAALQGVVRVADRNTVEFDAARAAIAKATGE